MKIITSIFNQLSLENKKYHVLTFSSTYHQMEFRDLLRRYFRNRKGKTDSRYLYLVDYDGRELKHNEVYFINFNCSITNLSQDKTTEKQLKEMLYFFLENHPEFVEEYMQFNKQLEQFLSSIKFEKENLLVDFLPSSRTVKQLINSLDIEIEYEEERYVPNYVLRHYLIELLLSLNESNKPPLLFLVYPESDVGHEDFSIVIEKTKSLGITTLVLTAEKEFITATKAERMFLVQSNGELYDVEEVRDELISLNYVKEEHVDKIAKEIAYYDFRKQYEHLNSKLKKFIVSSKL